MIELEYGMMVDEKPIPIMKTIRVSSFDGTMRGKRCLPVFAPNCFFLHKCSMRAILGDREVPTEDKSSSIHSLGVPNGTRIEIVYGPATNLPPLEPILLQPPKEKPLRRDVFKEMDVVFDDVPPIPRKEDLHFKTEDGNICFLLHDLFSPGECK
eukprot:TRINITY_DN1489_c0_g1_i5.p1 TRINITY_DN1489_c0_g1~~TRINITY_DN1489_c0_g1_i5.p1  ORF type:complete len:154 (+),score=22.61 TRINITY_DN1489_c0_g1_i5:217-678(+)